MTPAHRIRWAKGLLSWLDGKTPTPPAAAPKQPRHANRSTGTQPDIAAPERVRGSPASTAPGSAGILPAGAAGVSPARSRPATPRDFSTLSLDAPIAALPRLRKETIARLAKLGVNTLRDALYFFPRKYVDFSHTSPIADAEPGKEVTIVGAVWQAVERSFGPRRKATVATIADHSGSIRAIWFNQPYLAAQFRVNTGLALSGKVSVYQGQKQIESPEYEVLSQDGQEQTHTGRLVPLYPLTEGLAGRTVRQLIKTVVDGWAGRVPDPLPERVRARYQFLDLPSALRQAHYPDDVRAFVRARRRLAFEELLAIQLWMRLRRIEWQAVPAKPIRPDPAVLADFQASLPFSLTAAQQAALEDVFADLSREQPMSRLLQGDVGSGKTVVAAAALVAAVSVGQQGALMAPTEILAEQHYRSLTRLLLPGVQDEFPPPGLSLRGQRGPAGHSLGMKIALLGPIFMGGAGGGGDIGGGAPWQSGGAGLRDFQPSLWAGDATGGGAAPVAGRPRLRIALLIGSLSPAAKRRVHQQAASGEIDILVGTHALIQEGVEFRDLGLAVIDEQHRFGTAQRLALRQKGGNPHVLVMTATPVPRSLALTLYGDLESTIIGEMPPGRQQIITRALVPEQREEAEEFIRVQVQQGRQAFVVCPLIEESEQLQARAANAEYERLSLEVFPEFRVGLLHGRMPPAEKETVMRRFRDREVDILVSTTVIEVGIDIPNATVMCIEGGDRFGLSQLHQLRGRVGRGAHQSHCIILNESENPEVAERLALMERYADGFRLSEADFRLRGAGRLTGTAQSGLSELRMARLPQDQRLLNRARTEAKAILDKDPALTGHEPLRELVDRLRPSENADLS